MFLEGLAEAIEMINKVVKSFGNAAIFCNKTNPEYISENDNRVEDIMHLFDS